MKFDMKKQTQDIQGIWAGLTKSTLYWHVLLSAAFLVTVTLIVFVGIVFMHIESAGIDAQSNKPKTAIIDKKALEKILKKYYAIENQKRAQIQNAYQNGSVTKIPHKKIKPIADPVADAVLSKSHCPHFTRYLKVGEAGEETKKVQAFLKRFGFYKGEITGQYDSATDDAIRAFQATFPDEILQPWQATDSTGIWYKSTRHKANELMGCEEGDVLLENGKILH